MKIMKRAVLLARASSTKQVVEGDTLEDQVRQCTEFIEKQKLQRIKIFPLVESGRSKEREFFDGVIEYCKNPKNRVDYVVFKNISRFTRGGASEYLRLKESLNEAGVEIRDIYGTIKEEVNTLERYGLEYNWSKYSPSQSEETYEANKAKDFIRDQLTQMIGAEIEYVRKGYWNRRPPYGCINKKVETQKDGKRNILIEHSKESFFIKRIYKLRASGTLTDEEIVSKLNKLGYKSRRFCKRDRKTKKVIGYCGQKPLTVKQLQKMIQRPIYAGVICEHWTHFQPVKASFKGLVSIDLFNQANQGKIAILEANENLQIKYNQQLTKSVLRRLKNNPLYPFKQVVMCPYCGKPPKASASKGKMGKKYPAYHCARCHKYWRVPRDEFHKTIYDFFKKLKFQKKFINLFEKVFLEVWKEKRKEAVEESRKTGQYVADLLAQQKTVLDSIKTTGSEVVKKGLEIDYERLEEEIKQARQERDRNESDELDVKLAIKYAVHFVEHLDKLLVDEANPLQQQQLFGLVFEKLPTYNDLVSGTPKLAPIFNLISSPTLSKSELVNYYNITRTFYVSKTSSSSASIS